MIVVLAPTQARWAGARSRGLGTTDARASPSDVESPMYTTEQQDVRVGGGNPLRLCEPWKEAAPDCSSCRLVGPGVTVAMGFSP